MQSINLASNPGMPMWAKLRIAYDFADNEEITELSSLAEHGGFEKPCISNPKNCSTYCQTAACQVHCGGNSQIPF